MVGEVKACSDVGARVSSGMPTRRGALAQAASMAVLASLVIATPALSQSADSTTTEVEELVVTGEKLDLYDVLPDRQTDSVFGTSRSLADTPRSVTLIESSLIDLYNIQTVNDFVNITPGAFTGNYFGVAGALDVRGERADNFFRGFRRIENRGNFATPVGASQFTEVIKGPPPIIYGGGKVGGVLNFVPKSAKTKDAVMMSEPGGEASVTLGTYDKRLGSAEVGVPFSIGDMPSGAYVYTQLEDSKHYYRNVYKKNALIQVALNTEVTPEFSLEYGGMLQKTDLNQSLGWNRVTQQLIDTKGDAYLAGRPLLNLDANGDGRLSPSEIQRFSLEQFAFRSPFPFFALTPNQRAAFALDPATVRLTPISHRTVQVEKSDYSKSDVYTAYFDMIYNPTDGIAIKNQTFFDKIDHQKFSSYGFTADYEQWVFENKTTVNMPFSLSESVAGESVFGFSYRKSKGVEQESRGRGFQVLDRRDISFGATANDRFEGAASGLGNVPYNWVQDATDTDASLFGVLDLKLGDRFSTVLGGRVDNFKVKVRGTDVAGVYGNAKDSDTAFSYNASANFKISEDINLYATYATSRYLELGQGGMVSFETVAGDTWLQPSKMLEAGIKGYLYYKRIYFNALWYDQKKTSFNTLAGAFDKYKSDGVEIEVRAAATETLSFTAAATFQKTTLQNAPFFLGVPPSVLGLNPAQTYGGRFVAVGDLIGFSGPLEVPSPDRVFSLNGTYTSEQGWGASVGATSVSSFFSGYAKAVKLPAYTVTRAAAFFDIGPVHVRINANNLLNKKYYNPQFLFWDTFISPSVGRTADITVTYKW
jgi:iron complex outermembrane receptor protein